MWLNLSDLSINHLLNRMQEMAKVRTLSIRQPYVAQIFCGQKKIEYRTWKTSHLGWLAIHASTSRADLGEVDEREFQRLFPNGDDDLQLGCVVGFVQIVGYEGSPGDYEWQLAKPCRLLEPFETRGQATIFYVDVPDKLMPTDIKRDLELNATAAAR